MLLNRNRERQLLLTLAVVFVCTLLLSVLQFPVKLTIISTAFNMRFRLDTVNTSGKGDGFTGVKLFRLRPLILWNTDSHPAPSVDTREFVEPMGARLLLHSYDDDRCRYFDLCASHSKVKVLSQANILAVDDIRLMSKFYDAYKDDSIMQSVDAFLCADVIATCQLYMQFNKPIIIVAVNRYYVTREDTVVDNRPSPRWQKWTNDFKQIASNPRNVIAANNMYDVNFIRYFTGIKPIYIPSFCGYTKTTYYASNSSYLIQKNRFSVLEDWMLHKFRAFSWPSLLIKWDLKYWLLKDRTRPGYMRNPPVPPHEPSQHHLPSPNDEYNTTAMDYWLQFADYYTMPYIQVNVWIGSRTCDPQGSFESRNDGQYINLLINTTANGEYFDSIEHLVDILCRLTPDDLHAISRRMQEYNKDLKIRLTDQWKKIMLHVAKHSSNHHVYENLGPPKAE